LGKVKAQNWRMYLSHISLLQEIWPSRYLLFWVSFSWYFEFRSNLKQQRKHEKLKILKKVKLWHDCWKPVTIWNTWWGSFDIGENRVTILITCCHYMFYQLCWCFYGVCSSFRQPGGAKSKKLQKVGVCHCL